MKISSFARQVYRLTATIPRGRVASYGGIARALKRPGAARAVGNALNENSFAPEVPCHRVVLSTGEVGGYAEGSAKKIARLKKEGVAVKKGKINLKKYAYKFPAER